MSSTQLPTTLKHDVYTILSALKKALNEYELWAAKHGFLSNDDSSQLREVAKKTANPTTFRERISLRMRDLKRSANWALFDKEKILDILKEYSEWTARLRQTMSLVLLTLSAFKGTALEEFRKSRRAKDLRLQEVATRQALANLARYGNGWGRAEDVVVERRKYSKELRRATDSSLPDLDNLKAPIRKRVKLTSGNKFYNGRHRPIPKYALGALEQLPLEIINMVVDSIPQYKAIIKHAPASLRGIISIGTGRWISCQDLHDKLCTAECDSCGDFGGYL
ncbi:hypothetical protein BBP40_002204 [Aspergillus hancockii]|nr:hypothetical protein BBP40_002204 [Aspergillus hancockii]